MVSVSRVQAGREGAGEGPDGAGLAFAEACFSPVISVCFGRKVPLLVCPWVNSVLSIDCSA